MEELKHANPTANDFTNTRRDLLGAFALAATSALGGQVKAQTTNPGPLKSAGILAFGPNNVLFVGDITGAAVHALALREKDLTPQTDVEVGNFHNFEGRDLIRGLDQKLAAMFGTTQHRRQ